MSEKEITYRRELNHSYMVIPCKEPNLSGSYSCRTLVENRIGRLLEVSLRSLDGSVVLYYDISSRQPLERLYEAGSMGAEKLERILRAIADMQEDLGEYLLDVQGLLLEQELIFADVETEELFFCYDPDRTAERYPYAALADFLLERVDHGEEHAVNIAYQFYKMSKTEYFVLSSFLPFLEKELAQRKRELPVQEPFFREELPGERLEQSAWNLDGQTAERLMQPAEGTACLPRDREKTEEKQQEKNQEKETQKKKKKRRGLFGWLRPGKRSKPPESTEPAWPDAVWDSYEQQLSLAGGQETVYFTDMEKAETGWEKGGRLQEINGKRQFMLENFPVTVGKLKGKVSIVLSDASVSRVHARFETGEGGIFLRDLNSRNGTVVNGEKLAPNETVLLKSGDLLRFGRESFRYEKV